jgi:hypothetical protein
MRNDLHGNQEQNDVVAVPFSDEDRQNIIRFLGWPSRLGIACIVSTFTQQKFMNQNGSQFI